MKSIVVVFDQEELHASPFDKKEYFDAYRELSELAESHGARMYFARGKSAYRGSNSFSNVSFFRGHDVVEGDEVVLADVIYDKSRYFDPGSASKVINPAAVKRLANDKSATYKLLSEFSPQSAVVKSMSELEMFASGRERIVVKPRDGAQGDGVQIGTLDEMETPEFPIIAQEFIDTSAGIEGIVDGVHDLRIIVANGLLFCSYVRTPAPGSLLANVTQGGSLTFIDAEGLPEQVKTICKLIDTKLSGYGDRFYSVDLAHVGNDVYKLIELNSQPSVWSNKRGMNIANYQKSLMEFLVRV